jgi:hypothetical protein
MSPEAKAAIIGATIGAIGAILGGVVNSLFNLLTQRAQFRADRHKEMLAKRVAALQSFVMMIDFITMTHGEDLDGAGGEAKWLQIWDQSFSNVALLPMPLQNHVRLLLKNLLEGAEKRIKRTPENELQLLKLRDQCLHEMARLFE